jgi:Tol biopolymer transport system component
MASIVIPFGTGMAHSALAAPPAAARLWTPPAVASPGYESSPTFTADGREMYFLSADAAFGRFRIMVTRCERGAWSKPSAPSFTRAAPVNEADPFITPDGRRLWYISTFGDAMHENFDIWYVDRRSDGRWSEPVRLPEPVNSSTSELLPRQDSSGTLWFGSARPGGLGQGDIYTADLRDGVWHVENVGAPVNTESFEYEAEISRDGRQLIVVADRVGRSHLYRYERRDGRWSGPGEIAAKHDHFQVGPLLSPRGDRLLFAQREEGLSGEIYLLDLAPRPDLAWPPACR